MSEEVRMTVCGLCVWHCPMEVKISDGRVVSVESKGFKGCPRSLTSPEILYHPDRLNYPLKRAGERGENKWQRISWEQALDEIADGLSRTRDKYGPEAVCMSIGGDNHCSGEYLARFTNLVGSPNLISHARVCYMPTMLVSLMISGWIIPWPIFRPETRCLMVIGANPSRASWRLWNRIRRAKDKGLKLVVIDPRLTDTAMIADIWLRPRPGTDAALLLGMANVIVNEGLYDRDFVANWCYGWDKFVERVSEYPPEVVSEITWVPAEDISEAARLYATNKPGICFEAMGIEHARNSVAAMQIMLILPAITGQLDAPGGNLLLEPHPGIRLAAEIEGSEFLSPQQKMKAIGSDRFRMFSWEVFDRVGEFYEQALDRPFSYYYLGGVAHPPSVFRAMITGEPYPVEALITICQNPLLNFANTRLVYEAMKKVNLSVNMDIFMTSACELADYVLPAAGHLEKPTMGHGGNQTPLVEAGATAIKPLYERRNEYDFIRELGLRLGQEGHWPWKTLEEAYDYRLEPLGLTFGEFVGGQNGYGFNNPWLRHRKYDEPGFQFGTPTGKFELYSTAMEDIGYDPLPGYTEPPRSLVSDPERAKEFPLILIAGPRARHTYHSQFHQVESFRKKYPHPIAQMNPMTAGELGIGNGDWVWIETPLGRVKFKCAYFDGIDPRLVTAEHGWWFPKEPGEEPSLHGLWQSNINVVVDDDLNLCDPQSGAWTFREQLCRVYKADG